MYFILFINIILNNCECFLVEKTIYNQNFKVLFVVGIEGSGHKFWNTGVVNRCLQFENCPFIKNENVSSNFMCMGASILDDDLNLMKKYKNCRENLYKNLLHCKMMHNDGSILTMVSGENMLSFPNWDGSQKFAQFPATIDLIEICEELKIDLRILYLNRNYIDILQTVVSWNIGKTPIREVRSLEISSALIYRDLSMIDPGYFICTNYEDLFDETYNFDDEINFMNTKPIYYYLIKKAIDDERKINLHKNENLKIPESLDGELSTIQLKKTLEFINLNLCTLKHSIDNLNIYLIN